MDIFSASFSQFLPNSQLSESVLAFSILNPVCCRHIFGLAGFGDLVALTFRPFPRLFHIFFFELG